jgi:hypothetical protein
VRTITCDKCLGKINNEDAVNVVEVFGVTADLCGRCRDRLMRWLRESDPQAASS